MQSIFGEAFKVKTTLTFIATFCAVQMGASPCLAQNQSAQVKPSVAPAAGPASRNLLHDFGSARAGQVIVHRFVLRNSTPKPLQLTRLVPTCECLALPGNSQPGGKLPAVAAGGETEIDVALDTARTPEASGTTLPGATSGKQASVPAEGDAVAPVVGQAAPPLKLADTEGRTRNLAEFHGRPVVLCFFCGCQACHDCAGAWSQMQRSGALAPGPKPAPKTPNRPSHSITRRKAVATRSVKIVTSAPGRRPTPKQTAKNPHEPAPTTSNPMTVVVYMGDKDAARAFALATGLDPTQTTLLPDADYKVTQSFQAVPCPRICVMDPSGIVRYVSRNDNSSETTSAATILSHIVDTLRQSARR